MLSEDDTLGLLEKRANGKTLQKRFEASFGQMDTIKKDD